MTEMKKPRSRALLVVTVGIAMAVALVFLILYFVFTNPGMAKILSAAFVTHSFGGRAAGVGLCIMAGLSPFWNTMYNMYLEVMIVCFMYYLFVYSLTHHIRTHWVLSFVNNLRETAEKNKDKIGRYGWLGLFLFVMAPLPFTGPVMGSIIGYLLRMRASRNFSAVFLGTYAAIILWVVCFGFLEEHLHMIQYFLVVILAIVLFFHFRTIKALFFTKNK
jgi:uncharacterized membrane protein